MSRPYSDSDLVSQITQDRTWRMKELADLTSAIHRADLHARDVLLRALVAICYAHWEGYVRFAASKYLLHVALRKIPYRELNRQFLRNYFLPRLGSLMHTKGSFSERCALVDDILSSFDKRFSQVNEDLINTHSNLNFNVFCDICMVCGIATSEFVGMRSFIDVFLLKRRNSIAHGEDTFVEIVDLQDLVGNTIQLMRTFGNLLENNAVLKDYKAAA